MPDALSKTVPTWCTVINRAVQRRYPDPEKATWDTSLYCPPGGVSQQEVNQIEQRIPEWVDALVFSSYALPDLPKPLRPFWVTPATSVLPRLPDSVISIVCVSASRAVSEGFERRTGGFAYVQGSGDDHELWGMGLTPSIFWERKDDLLSADRAALPSLVQSLTETTSDSVHAAVPTPVAQVRGRILVGAISGLPLPPCSTLHSHSARTAFVIVNATASADSQANESISDKENDCIRMHLPEGKKGQTAFLETVLPRSIQFIGLQLSQGAQVCICCATGKDVSAGIAVAALQLFFDEAGCYLSDKQEQAASRASANKQSIHTRLQWVISSRPQVNPSRATLKRVNEFILTPPTFRH